MNAVKSFSSNLIALRNRLGLIEQRSKNDDLDFESSDIDLFSKISNEGKTAIEQKLMVMKLDWSSNKYDFYTNRIISDLDVCILFWNRHSVILEKYDYKSLIEKELLPYERSKEEAYLKLRDVSKKKSEITHNLESNCMQYGEEHSIMKKLRIQEDSVTKKFKELKMSYGLAHEMVRENERELIKKYSDFKFEEVLTKLNEVKEIILSLKNDNKNPSVQLETFGMDQCGLFRRFTKDLLEKPPNDITFFNLLNRRSNGGSSYRIKKGCVEKFLFVIKCFSDNAALNSNDKNKWERYILKYFGQNADSTYSKKGRNLAVNYTEFREEVETAFRIISN